jgi:hypothetical protein
MQKFTTLQTTVDVINLFTPMTKITFLIYLTSAKLVIDQDYGISNVSKLSVGIKFLFD